jgi:hypothetical protein
LYEHLFADRAQRDVGDKVALGTPIGQEIGLAGPHAEAASLADWPTVWACRRSRSVNERWQFELQESPTELGREE